MKICINCKWHQNSACKAPQNLKLDIVTGEQGAKLLMMCKSHRTGAYTGKLMSRLHGLCGLEGRWYVEKSTG